MGMGKLLTELSHDRNETHTQRWSYDRVTMLTFMSEQTLDVDPYIVVVKLWTYVTESFEVFVGYEPQWYLKDPPASPVPRVEDFGLVNVDPALLHVVPPPPAPPVEGNGDNEIIDLTSDTESEID
ncbi:hypothetical protein CJ030_MR7G002564 [Morella rubra]|uniref:Uncharacterized protein n=1 Tax=Morella rubra TaxID=262757 RepID=A0A6A1V5B2_9ROSI|nr:hypothetical protein CJ030_MR7G002564 [Morella rubra]